MQRVSERLKSYIYQSFYLSGSYVNSSYESLRNNTSLADYDLIIRTVKSNGHMIAPIKITHSLRGAMINNFLPLMPSNAYNIRSADVGIRYSMSERCRRYVTLNTNKGELYYAGYGFICDRNHKPILITAVELSSPTVICKYLLYVSPSVFTSEGLMEKMIVNKFIPVCAGGIYVERSSMFNYIEDRTRVIPDIIVTDDIDKFIYTPQAPDNLDNREFNQVILNDVDRIITW